MPKSPCWNYGPLAARLLGALSLFALGLLVAGLRIPYGAEAYDEGLIATGAAYMLRGRLPGVDFYAPYPPGAFGALALAFQFWGVRLLVERWLAAALAALAAVLGFWLISSLETSNTESTSGAGLPPPSSTETEARRACSPGWWVAWLAGLGITLLLEPGWLTPIRGGTLAFVLATGLALRVALPLGRPAAACLCGTLAGATALWRLDFGAYTLAAGTVVCALRAGYAVERKHPERRRVVGAVAFVLGAFAVSGPLLMWIVAKGGRRAALSLFWWPICGTAAAHMPWTRHWTAYLLPLASLSLLASGVTSWRRDPLRSGLALWLLLVALGFLVYSLGLTNAGHLLPLRMLALLAAALARSTVPSIASATSVRAPRQWMGDVVFGALLATTAAGAVARIADTRTLRTAYRVSLPGTRGAGIYPSPRQARDYECILTYLRHDVPPSARLFCGTHRHDIFLKDDNLIYFLSDHESGTYYWCLDAGVTSRLEVQAEMARELEASHVEVVLIHTADANCQPNAGGHSSGVHLLDDYLRRQYHLVAVWPDYEIYRRRPAARRAPPPEDEGHVPARSIHPGRARHQATFRAAVSEEALAAAWAEGRPNCGRPS